MTDELKKEWTSIINKPNIYIYGAAKTAETMYSFISGMGYKQHIKGFLVTEGKDNVQELLGLEVKDIHNFDEKEACILVPHMGVYKEQISNLLVLLGFKNVYFVGQLRTKTVQEEREHIALDNGKVGREIYDKKTEIEKESDANLREQILTILRNGQPDFGGIKPYQSMEMIGLWGIRPTEYRIREYELRTILGPKDNVLDIGCNTGFLDLSISNLVQSVTGIEYDSSLVKIANLVKDYLKVPNCIFYNGDFNDWYRNTDTSYNVIFSFAIHHWLNITPQRYVEILNKLLRTHGYICFESHIYGADIEFDKCCKEFQNLNYQVIISKKINDDGMQEREYVLFRKIND